MREQRKENKTSHSNKRNKNLIRKLLRRPKMLIIHKLKNRITFNLINKLKNKSILQVPKE